ncbi:MAG TPA: 2-phosphosulfolactate phosphatase [Gemmatimonadaceae bacterium]|nr:2-phosphosulfolactate phosphatase [Gemmatimonadaceae bacterium]
MSPDTLRGLSPGAKVVLPSPNGSQLSTETGTLPTIAACLRNASAAAAKAKEFGQRISIIAAGERWHSSETLRPALEDLLGTGAVIAALTGTASPEAKAAATLFRATQAQIHEALLTCASGRELIEIGFGADVEFAAELDASHIVPVLIEGRYVRQ